MTTARRLLVLSTLATLVGCSGGPTAPPEPTIAQVAGLWRVTSKLVSVTGGECIGPLLAAEVGTSSDTTLAITQTGASLSGTSTDVGTGAKCQFTGTAGSNSFTINTTINTCDFIGFTATCSTDGAIRTVLIATSSATGTVTGATATGTQAETANVSVNGAPVGILSLQSTFTAQRQ